MQGIKSKQGEIILLPAKESLEECEASTYSIIKLLIKISEVCSIGKVFFPIRHNWGFYTWSPLGAEQ